MAGAGKGVCNEDASQPEEIFWNRLQFLVDRLLNRHCVPEKHEALLTFAARSAAFNRDKVALPAGQTDISLIRIVSAVKYRG